MRWDMSDTFGIEHDVLGGHSQKVGAKSTVCHFLGRLAFDPLLDKDRCHAVSQAKLGSLAVPPLANERYKGRLLAKL
jgi:hypothetical protein